MDLKDVGEVNKVYRICEPGPEISAAEKLRDVLEQAKQKRKTGRQDVKERTDAIGIAA